MKKLLYATSNPGKQKEVAKFLGLHNINIITPQELRIDIDPDESGNSLEENATIKVEAYRKILKDPHIIIMADDTGIEIDALDGEPGIHVRRWKGYRMEDEEIIEYCMQRMRLITKSKRGAQFRTVIAINSSKTEIFDGILHGEITDKPIKLRMKGFPFESIFYINEYNKMLGDIHQMSIAEKIDQDFLSHREKAITNSLPRIRELLSY